MIHSTKGIVLKYVNYGETSIISTIYTKKYGKCAFIINGIKGKKRGQKSIFLQALSLVDLQIYEPRKASIGRIKDFRLCYPFSSIPFSAIKTSIALFLTELLNMCLDQDEGNNESLFEFLNTSIQIFDADIDGPENFHLLFVLELTKQLGFYPNFNTWKPNSYFDINSGEFNSHEDLNSQFFNQELSKSLYDLSNIDYQTLNQLQISNQNRTDLLNRFMGYYAIHVANFGKIKSLEVLHQVFNG